MAQLAVHHVLPGRVRFKVLFPVASSIELERFVEKIPYIRSIRFTQETNSLLVYFDSKVAIKQLFIDVQHVVKLFWKDQKRKLVSESTNQSAETSAAIKKEISRIGIAVGAFVIERYFFPTSMQPGLSRLAHPATLAMLYAAGDIIKNGFKSLFVDKRITADTLTASAVLAAAIKGRPSSALTIVILSSVGELLTEYTANRTRNHITNMLKVDVPFVWRVDEYGKELKVPIETVQPGDTIAVFIGEKISVDGTIVGGMGSVDESSMTGEFIPKEVAEGSYVYAGSILKAGQIRIKVKHVGDGTAITRIIKLIEEAQSKQAPIQSFADKMSQSLVPVSFAMAGIVYFITRDWNRVMNMLFIDYACGLKLSTATAISASIGKAAKQGILVKGGQYIERLSNIDTVIFDKTGTITEGEPTIKQVYAFNGYTDREVIRFAASAEEHSSHPIASAIVNQAKIWNEEIPNHGEVETIVGRGIRSEIQGREILIGSDSFMTESGIDMSVLHSEQGADVRQKEDNLVFVGCDKKLMGVISIYDPVRFGMKRTINQLRRQGIDEIVLLTGDKKHNAQKISSNLFLDNYFAEALPEDKANIVKKYHHKGNTVMMVGDGINDAPALAYADIGVTLGGKRTDIAVEACDVIITGDDPLTLPTVIRLAQKTMNVIHQNFLATIVINSFAMLLGAAGTITPVVAAVIHNAATIGVVLNSSKILVTET
ncbi:hypothetical protein BHU72_06435 [Desulfuribacillus stibiiarsenatis]|uniref:Cd(2+)-exporting ATPase n=1 Tax=Desulfuribacillus stibiiarsenatis TaxID=1390249 RepID=A0A1E5L517_9FIRM|nr:heavy metal translocating P-type ATPase [Desulfuribacillus stibiiarsenatis]OEH85237.1 hypothetical protein BHU72_06435 [Desulfuribacillus stibiiarsenatis]